MSEERQYGLEDGHADAARGDKPVHRLDVEHDDDYQAAYVEGYLRHIAESQDA